MPVRVQQLPTPETAEKRLRQALAAAPEVVLTVDQTRLPGRSGDDPNVPYLPCPVTVAERGTELAVTGLPGGRVTMSWPELLDARWTHQKKYGGLFLLGTPSDPPELAAETRAAIARTVASFIKPLHRAYFFPYF